MKKDWRVIAIGASVLAVCIGIVIGVNWQYESVRASERSEHSGSGFVRSIDWYHRGLIFETDAGFQKSYWPLCDASSIPMWQGEHSEFNFRWASGVNYTQERGSGCYAIDWVKHLPPDVARP